MAGRQGFQPAQASFSKDLVERNVADVFFERVPAWLDRTAITTSSNSITYRELSRAIAKAAAALHRLTGGQKQNVALLLSDGVEAPIAILATLVAGCAYVPLDPRDPVERLQRIFMNSDARFLITDKQTREQAKEVATTFVRVIAIEELLRGPDCERPRVEIGPDDLAYIIYTSGSTGFPKGVMLTHRALLHKVYVLDQVAGIGPLDKVILIPSYSVGQSTGHLFASLLNGATLRKFNLVREGLAGLKECLKQEGITFYLSVPSIFRALGKHLRAEDHFPSVRVVELAGEQCLASDLDLFKAYFSDDCRFLNWLAATEANIAQHQLSRESVVGGYAVPAGYALPDCEIVLIGVEGRPSSEPGGEIGVRSRYIASGYWKDEALTRARFVPQEDGSVLYRTGDMGRWDANGALEVLGRADFQVKVRGHRVSIEEIEAVVGELPGVRQAAVKAFSKGGRTHLVGYVVTEANCRQDAAEALRLRTLLRAKLPAYMVPTVMTFVAGLPLNATGKVDRQALADPSDTSAQ